MRTVMLLRPICGRAVRLISLFWVLVISQSLRSPGAEPFDPAKLDQMDAEITQAISEGKLPGGVVWLEREGRTYHKSYGNRALVPQPKPMTEDTIFDVASLTKVAATTPALMLLLERGKLKLDEPVQSYIPEFKGDGKERITIRHLLTHTSGLKAGLSRTPDWTGYKRGIELACAERPINAPGAAFLYSDINFILLGEVVRRVSGKELEEFVQSEIYQPLDMVDTSFLPSRSKISRVAPTQKVDGEILCGKVHDPSARRMGGVAGHAGLFTTASDLACFVRMLLNGGSFEGVRLFKAETIKLMTSVQSPEGVSSRRGLGWDIDSGYSRPRGEVFPLGSYGHTGFTGASLWIDPFSQTFLIFLSNRIHPDGTGNISALQSKLGTLAAESIQGFDFASVPGALPHRPEELSKLEAPTTSTSALGSDVSGVLNGIDVLAKEKFRSLTNLRIGLITNHTGKDRKRHSTAYLLKSAPGVQLRALFSPEHGLHGNVDADVTDSTDPESGLPVFSLYGKHRAPTPDQLQDLDALVFDIQDIGCRFYTYISTLGLAMEAADKAGIKFFVLDRVNPINGTTVDGPVLTGETSFVAYHQIPVRHGMTVGELAQMFKAERNLSKLGLVVIPLEGWRRDFWFDQTGLPWTNPSPNMRSVTEAALYPGIGLLETTELSVGRGTGTPFEVVGAPYIDDVVLAAELNKADLVGVRFVAVRFTPTDNTFKGESCGGVSILLTDRERCHVVEVGITIAKALNRLYPRQFSIEKFDRLLKHRATIEAIKGGQEIATIKTAWSKDLERFKERRALHLLYK
jgi:uncharacterized protein YbbC (DUF1343 family)/CubicO group peptidase (beta-lactamase class C family)